MNDFLDYVHILFLHLIKLIFRDGNNFVTFSVKSIENIEVRNDLPEETEKNCQNMVTNKQKCATNQMLFKSI